jgi:hypothetical protein
MRPRTLLFAVVALGLLASAYAQDQESSEPDTGKSTRSEPLLRRNVVVSIKDIARLFPEIIKQTDSGADTGAPAQPLASRMVVFASRDGAKKLTLTVDQYKYGSQAVLAYEEAARKSDLPEFEPIAIANVGQKVFAGALKQGGETRILVAAVDDTILVAAILAGYEDTTENISKLADLARLEVSEARARVKGRR